MRKLSILAALCAAGLATAACDIKTSANGNFSFDIAAGKATETWSRTYKLADKGRFELINVNGRITAEATDGSEVVVEGRKTAKRQLNERFEKAIDRAAMRAGLRDTDSYLAEWRRADPVECGADLEAEASAAAERLEADYPDERLKALVASGGREGGQE